MYRDEENPWPLAVYNHESTGSWIYVLALDQVLYRHLACHLIACFRVNFTCIYTEHINAKSSTSAVAGSLCRPTEQPQPSPMKLASITGQQGTAIKSEISSKLISALLYSGHQHLQEPSTPPSDFQSFSPTITTRVLRPDLAKALPHPHSRPLPLTIQLPASPFVAPSAAQTSAVLQGDPNPETIEIWTNMAIGLEQGAGTLLKKSH